MSLKGKINFGKIPAKLSVSLATNSEEIKNETVCGFGTFTAKQLKETTYKKDNRFPKTESQSSSSKQSIKKAQTFNVEQLAQEVELTAKERNRERLEKLLEDQETISSNPFLHQQSRDAEDSDSSSGDESSDDDFIGPPLPPGLSIEMGSYDCSTQLLPASHELYLKHGNKTVTAIAVDPSGSRLVTGGIDYDIKYWDFQGMDLSKEAFRTFRPYDGYPVHSVDYSCTGDKVLVVTGSVQAKVYDRDGAELFECVRGDMYLRDMAKTKGHTASLTDGKWHPKVKEEFLTSANDGTCRIWYTSRPTHQQYVIKPRSITGLKTIPTASTYSRDGLTVACACNDGSIQMWDHRKNYVNTIVNIKNAHEKGSETSSISFSYDGKSFATRGGDDTLKLWDIRNIKQPINSANNLFNRFISTDCTFSPNDKLIITGCSVDKGEKSGKLLVFERDTMNCLQKLEVGSSHIVKCIWHPKLNQIMIGCGDGQVCILYSPEESRNGAVVVAGKHHRRLKAPEVMVSQQVITPHALPLFREERHKSTRKVEERDRKDPVRSHRPDLPLGKTGSGGRVSSGGSTLSSYIIRNMGIRNKALEEADPREALLKYAKDAKENPYWVSPAYAKTQPKTIFHTEETEDQQPSKKQKQE